MKENIDIELGEELNEALELNLAATMALDFLHQNGSASEAEAIQLVLRIQHEKLKKIYLKYEEDRIGGKVPS